MKALKVLLILHNPVSMSIQDLPDTHNHTYGPLRAVWGTAVSSLPKDSAYMFLRNMLIILWHLGLGGRLVVGVPTVSKILKCHFTLLLSAKIVSSTVQQ